MASKLKLYTQDDSGNCYKVKLLASILSIDLELVEVDFYNNEQQSEAFLALNPRGTIPVLIDGNTTLTDSAAILTYLAGKFPDPKTGNLPSSFWSADIVEQSFIIDWLVFAASWVQYGICTARCMVSFNAPYYGLGTDWTEQTLKEAHIRGRESLQLLQQHLERSEWLALDRPTIAEMAVFPYVALAPMGDIELEPYPAVVAWIERVKQLPGFIPMKGLNSLHYHKRVE